MTTAFERIDVRSCKKVLDTRAEPAVSQEGEHERDRSGFVITKTPQLICMWSSCPWVLTQHVLTKVKVFEWSHRFDVVNGDGLELLWKILTGCCIK